MPHSAETVQKVAASHGIDGSVEIMPASGMVNEAWLLDNRFVLRIIVAEDADDEPAREAFVVPLVRGAGVRSPELIACDTEKKEFGFLYTIYRKADGELLGHLDEEPDAFDKVYRELGREIALLHTIPIEPNKIPLLRETSSFDAHKQLQKSVDAGKVDVAEIGEIENCIGELESRIGVRDRRAFLHQDIHPWNMFVDPASHEVTAIIDWGDSAWGDPAGEFSSMPLQAVPEMFAGYKEAGGQIDDCMVARSLHLGLALCLWEARDLDPARFRRQWWRHSPKGFGEDVRIIRELLG